MKALLPLALPLIAAGDLSIAPGKWTATVEITELTMPNAPPGVAAAMWGRPMTATYCVTPAQARQGMRGALRPDSGCTFTRFEAIGGRIRTRMVCNHPTGRMTAVSSGIYTATGFATTSITTGTGRIAMTMKSRGIGHRVGPC